MAFVSRSATLAKVIPGGCCASLGRSLAVFDLLALFVGERSLVEAMAMMSAGDFFPDSISLAHLAGFHRTRRRRVEVRLACRRASPRRTPAPAWCRRRGMAVSMPNSVTRSSTVMSAVPARPNFGQNHGLGHAENGKRLDGLQRLFARVVMSPATTARAFM